MDREEEIKLIAYYLWESEGCPAGCHQEHWLKAEIIWQERQTDQTILIEVPKIEMPEQPPAKQVKTDKHGKHKSRSG